MKGRYRGKVGLGKEMYVWWGFCVVAAWFGVSHVLNIRGAPFIPPQCPHTIYNEEEEELLIQ